LELTADVRGFSNATCTITVMSPTASFHYRLDPRTPLLPETQAPPIREAIGVCGTRPLAGGIGYTTVFDASTYSSCVPLDGGPPFATARVEDCLLFRIQALDTATSDNFKSAFGLSAKGGFILTAHIECAATQLYADVSRNTCLGPE
jgi:hypothetical protein